MTAPVKKAVLDMVCEAISEVGVLRKGASFPAIKKYVIEKYYTEETKGIKTNLKKAIEKGLEKNILRRAAASKNAHGAIGSFMLEPKTKGQAKKPRVNKPTEPTETVSDSEVTINKGRPKIRRALSDTELSVTVTKEKVVPSGKLMKKEKVVPSGKLMKKEKVAPSEKLEKEKVVPTGKSKGKPPTEKSEKKALYDPSNEVPLKKTGTSAKGKPKAKKDPNAKPDPNAKVKTTKKKKELVPEKSM